ncbi:hypothetical protein ACFE04_023005 [Oxalis oulophora]
MEESQEILLKSLKQSGVSLPGNVSSISEMNPSTLISICAQSLNLINHDYYHDTVSFQSRSMADKFKICTEISSAIKNLGFIGDLTYYKLLYPSEEDLYKLLRFFVERLSELSENDVKNLDVANEEVEVNLDRVGAILNDIRISTEVPEPSNGATMFHPLQITDYVPSPRSELESLVVGSSLASDLVDAKKSRNNEENDTTLLKEQSSEITHETEKLGNQENELLDDGPTKSLDLDEEYDLLKSAAEMAFDDRQSVECYLEQLNQQIDVRKHNIVDLESKWDAFRKPLEEKKRSLEDSLCENIPEAQEKLQKFREVEAEMLSVLEEENSKLSADFEKQPKVAPRRSYIHRIMEITKNSRKLDADIERILKETREIQLEKNSIQERLDRTYAIIDEIVFREAKKDQVGRQAYRLLTSIHDTFEQISEKILATDRIQREVAEYEKKLAGLASRSLNADKLQADLDAIIKENEYLEQCRST